MEADKGMQSACYDCVYRGTIVGDCHSRCLQWLRHCDGFRQKGVANDEA